MFRTHLLSQAVFRSIFTPPRDMGEPADASICYIGLGDQFDDDRRLVRPFESALRPPRLTTAGISSRIRHPTDD